MPPRDFQSCSDNCTAAAPCVPASQSISLLMVTNELARGGAEAMLLKLAGSVNLRLVRPVIVCLRQAGVWAAPANVALYDRLLRHKLDAAVILRLRRLLRQHWPACVMAVGNGGDRMFWAALAARSAGAPMIVWSHMCPVPGHLTFEWINRRLYPRVDAFVALGQRHREALISLEGIPSETVTVIPNGIDVDAFARPDLREIARRELGAVEGEVLIGIVANLRPDKRHDLFIQAAKRTFAVRPQCRFAIIGDGPERDRVTAAASGCQFIRLLGPRDDVPLLLQGLDVVCLTSQWQECLSVAMLEAMAAAKVFVAPRIGSLDEALVDGVTGRFFAPVTPEQLSHVLVELVDDPAARQRLGAAAQAKVRAEFTQERMARRFEELVVNLAVRHGLLSQRKA